MLKYSIAFRYIFVYLVTPMIHFFYSAKVEHCSGCAMLATTLICCVVMSIVTIINVLKILYNFYIYKITVDRLNEEHLIQKNNLIRQQIKIIIVFLLVFLLLVSIAKYNDCLWIFIFAFLSGAFPIPFFALIDILFYLELCSYTNKTV